MKAYVQGEKELIPLQEELTSNSVKNALGYTPANEEDLPDITNVDDSALYVTDKDGNIITKTDGEGFHAKAMTVNGKDVESGLVTDEDRESWGGSDLDDVISKDDDSTLYVVDKDNNVLAKIDSEGLKAIEVYVGEDQKSVSEHIEDESSHTTTEEKEALSALSSSDDSVLYVTDKNGDIIAKIDKDGLHTTEVYIGDETGEKTVADMLAALVGAAPETLNTLEELATAFKEHEEVAAALDEAITNKADATDFETHKVDYESHKTDYASQKSDYATHKAAFERHKGDSTHLGDEIKLDDDTSLCIVDKDGKIIAKIDGDGLDVTDLKVSSLPIDEYINDVVENNGEACDHEYVTIQELIRNTTDCTTWKDLQYCSSCGKVHANLLYSAHDYSKSTVAPTYTAQGYDLYACTKCSNSYKGNYTDKLIANITWSTSGVTYDGTEVFPSTWEINTIKSMKITIYANVGYTLPDTITVTGCEHIWEVGEGDSVQEGVLVLEAPTSDISVTINAVANEYAVTLSRKNSGSSWTSSTIKAGQSTILPISVNTGYWLDISEASAHSSVVVYGCEYSISQSTLYLDNYTITLSNPYRDVLVAVAPKISGGDATLSTYNITFHTIGCTISYTGGAVAYGGTVEIPVSAMSTNDGYTSIDYSGIKATNCTCTWNNYTGVLTLNNISGDVIVVASAT